MNSPKKSPVALEAAQGRDTTASADGSEFSSAVDDAPIPFLEAARREAEEFSAAYEEEKLGAAFRYAARDWRVLQIPRGKLKGDDDAETTTDPDRIRAMWRKQHDANIGIDLRDAGLCVLEVEVDGKLFEGEGEGMTTLIDIGMPPETLRARTPFGTAQMFFRIPKGTFLADFQELGPGLKLYTGRIAVPPGVLGDSSLEWINDDDEEIAELPENILNGRVLNFNQNHFVVQVGKNVFIAKTGEDRVYQRDNIVFYKPQDMTIFYATELPVQVSEKKFEPFFAHWIRHPLRRTYEGLVFEPEGEAPDGYFNLWRGFAVEPREGDCSLYLDLVRDVICSGDADLYRWVIAWMADAVQHPAQRPGTAIALRGGQGTGKGTMAKWFGSLFGQHFLHIVNTKHLTGNFNNHFKDSLFVFADEAFWAGDKSAEGVLKALITEDLLAIEGKFQDLFIIRNHVRLLLASNKDWVIPAEHDDRRYCVIDVSESRKQDTTYFGDIAKQMDSGGREALLHHLLHLDISDVDLRHTPKTAAHDDQKILSMQPVESWWLSKLQSGEMLGTTRGENDERVIFLPRLHAEFLDSARKRGISHLPDENTFAKSIHKLAPGIKRKQGPCPSGYGKVDKRKRYWVLPSLSECRAAFPFAQLDDDDAEDWEWSDYWDSDYAG